MTCYKALNMAVLDHITMQVGLSAVANCIGIV